MTRPPTLLPASEDRFRRWLPFLSRTLRNFLGIIKELAAFILSIAHESQHGTVGRPKQVLVSLEARLERGGRYGDKAQEQFEVGEVWRLE